MKDRGPDFVKEFDEELRRQLKFLDYAPVLHISAATGERHAEAARDDRPGGRRARDARQDAGAEHVREDRSPPRIRRRAPAARHVRILYAAQTRCRAADVRLLHQRGDEFHFSYERFLVNQLREEFGFVGRRSAHVRRRHGAAAAAGESRSRLSEPAVILGPGDAEAVQGGGGLRSDGAPAVRAAVVGEGISRDRGAEVARDAAAVPAVGRRSGAADQAARVRRGADAGRGAASAGRGAATGDEIRERGCIADVLDTLGADARRGSRSSGAVFGRFSTCCRSGRA